MNLKKSEISVITVTKNSLDALKRTKKSLDLQSFRDFEWIVVDGGSNDGTPEFLGGLKEKNIAYISEPDEGLYFAMNKAIEMANSDLIGILNADDTFFPDTLRLVNDAYKKEPHASIYYGRISKDGGGSYLINHEQLPKQMIYHPAVFVRKSVYKRIGKFNTKLRVAADYDFLMRAYVCKENFKLINEILADYRTGGYSSKNVSKSIYETIFIQLKHPSRFTIRNLGVAMKSIIKHHLS